MAARIVQLVCDESGLSFYGGCSFIIASNYARAACAASLQIIVEALNETSGFSIALDCSTLHVMSYLNVRFWFFLNDEMYNFHVSAVSQFDLPTGQIMFEVLVKFLDALYPEWRKFLAAVSSDGDRSMTRRIQGVLTRLSVEALLELYSICCSFNQFDLLMQRVYSESLSLFGKPRWRFLFNFDRCNWTSSSPTNLGRPDAFNMPESWWYSLGINGYRYFLADKAHYSPSAHFDAKKPDAIQISCGGCSCLSSMHWPRNPCWCLFRSKDWRL